MPAFKKCLLVSGNFGSNTVSFQTKLREGANVRLPVRRSHCWSFSQVLALAEQKLLTVLRVAASPLQVKGPKAVTGAAVGHEADSRPGAGGGGGEEPV